MEGRNDYNAANPNYEAAGRFREARAGSGQGVKT
jgi:hypothetical protein